MWTIIFHEAFDNYIPSRNLAASKEISVLPQKKAILVVSDFNFSPRYCLNFQGFNHDSWHRYQSTHSCYFPSSSIYLLHIPISTFRKYEKSKQLALEVKESESKLLEKFEFAQQQIKSQELRYDKLKNHALSQLEA